MREPNATSCDNPGFDDRWTTPCCYEDVAETRAGTYPCPSCGRLVRCTLERQPVCHAELVEDE